MTYGINGAKDKISIEMKDRCSIWNVESFYLFGSQSNAYSRKDFVLRPDTHAALHQALKIRFCGILDTKVYVQQTLMRFKRCDFEFGSYEFRVVTADIVTGYCHWSSNFTNLTVVCTPPIFPILIVLIYDLLITSFLFFVKRKYA
jgi:hypothetical protein